MTDQAPVKLLLTAYEAAKALSISPRTLFSISAPRGPLPVVRIGVKKLYDPVDLVNYIQTKKKVDVQ